MQRKARPPKSVVDTNLIVSGLLIRRGVPHELVGAMRAGAFVLLISAALRAEYERVLSRPKFREKYGLTGAEVAAFLEFVAASAVEVTPSRRLPVKVRDQADEKVLAAALGGGADYLVTGDDDLLSLRGNPRLRKLGIVTAREFLAILGVEVEGGEGPRYRPV